MIKNSILVVLLVFLCSCVMIQDAPGNLAYDSSVGFHFQTDLSDSRVFNAKVLGSIYTTGEGVSVFGTCLDGDDNPVSTSYAELSAWYPNGSVVFSYDSMFEVQPGYYLWTGPMNAVEGTYLTELRCRITSDPSVAALAWGEWQNPAWVAAIMSTNESIQYVEEQLQNITISLGDIEWMVEDGFNITFDKLDSLNTTVTTHYENVTNQLTYITMVANGSVDRNDSLLYYLLMNLTQIVTPVNLTDTLVNWTESYGHPVYRTEWEIRVDAFDPVLLDQRLTYPVVLCDINTPGTAGFVRMANVGNHFIHKEMVYTLDQWIWEVKCYYS